jgi:broad specificity phosphatase PhoE
LLLVRHATHAEVGHVMSGRSEIALDARGRDEARALAAGLARETIDAVHASPRRRAQETAAAVADGRGLPVQTATALDEIDFGDFTGRSFASLDADADWRQWNAERGSARCPGGETMREATARAWQFVAALPAGRILCVSHCDVIRGLVCEMLGLGYDRMFQLGCDPASVTEVAFDGDDVRLMGLNRRYVP